jgi:hypothetical protein
MSDHDSTEGSSGTYFRVRETRLPFRTHVHGDISFILTPVRPPDGAAQRSGSR